MTNCSECIHTLEFGGDNSKCLMKGMADDCPYFEAQQPFCKPDSFCSTAVKKRKDIVEDYDSFVNKFSKTAAKTTDDCYTPEDVYQAIKQWVVEEYKVDPDKCVRPFYPGGDYEKYEYPEGCVVLDNPPFSILAKIIKFYDNNQIEYFLFAPGLLMLQSVHVAKKMGCCCINACSEIVYHNGARVNTGFVTSLDKEYMMMSRPDLGKRIKDIQKPNRKKRINYEYPDNLIMTSFMNTLSTNNIDLRIKKNEGVFVREFEGQKSVGRDSGIFGGGLLLSTEATKRKVEAAKGMSHTYYPDAVKIELSSREKKMVEWLDNRAKVQAQEDVKVYESEDFNTQGDVL